MKKNSTFWLHKTCKQYVAISPDGNERAFEWEGYPWADDKLKELWKRLAEKAAKLWAQGNKSEAEMVQSELWGTW